MQHNGSLPSSHSASHVQLLDGLRGVAILAVVWYHLWLVTGVPSTLLAQTGFMGVDLFFFVSGFCLFYPQARHAIEGRARPTWTEFAERRVEKILPSYLLALGVMTAAHASWFASQGDLGWNVAAHLLFIHPLWFNTFGSISGPFWTLGVEVQFYALFPLLCGVFRRWPIVAYGMMSIVANGYRAWTAHAGLDTTLFSTNQLPAVVDVFGAGMLAAYAIVFLAQQRSGAWMRAAATACAVAAAACVYLLLVGLQHAAASGGTAGQYAWLNAHRGLFALSFLALATGSLHAMPAWRTLLANKAFVFLAAISYNLYLWHLEIIVWLNQLHISPLVAVACSIIAAWLITVAVERPLLKGGWRRVLSRLPRGARVTERDVTYHERRLSDDRPLQTILVRSPAAAAGVSAGPIV